MEAVSYEKVSQGEKQSVSLRGHKGIRQIKVLGKTQLRAKSEERVEGKIFLFLQKCYNTVLPVTTLLSINKI